MNTLEVRSHIMQKLNQINDLKFLNALKIIVDSTTDDNIYHLTEIQKEKLQESREQAKRGEVMDNDKVFEEIELWLEEK